MSQHSLESLLGAARRDVLDDQGVARVRAGLTNASVGVATAKGASVVVKLIATAFVGGALAIGGYLATRPPSQVAVIAKATPLAVTTTTVEPPPDPVVVVAPPVVDTIAPVKHASPPHARVAIAAEQKTSAREGLLLLRARSVLATDPQRTLDLVREHTTEFPTSQLGPERDKLRLEAETKGAH